MMYGMARMNYSDQIKAIAKVYEERTQKLKALPQEEAKVVARESLIRIGLIDESGNLAAPYVACEKDTWLTRPILMQMIWQKERWLASLTIPQKEKL